MHVFIILFSFGAVFTIKRDQWPIAAWKAEN